PLAAGPHPRRDLSLTPRRGFAVLGSVWPQALAGCEPRGYLCRDLDSAHHRLLGDAGDGHATAGEFLAVPGQRALVANRLLRHLRDAQVDVELVLEAQRAVELERAGDARPADVAVGRMNAEAGLAPHRVFGFLHVTEEPAEMHDAGDIGLVELDTAR